VLLALLEEVDTVLLDLKYTPKIKVMWILSVRIEFNINVPLVLLEMHG
jgi:hypothetical protein